MPVQDSDISWQLLRRIAQEWAGTSAELDEVKPLEGGCVSTVLALHLSNGDRAVLKVAPHRVNRAFEEEAYQLGILRRLGLPVPEVYAWSIGSLDNPFSYLLIEYVDGVDLATARGRCDAGQYDQLQEHLAALVLTMHQMTGKDYCRLSCMDCPKFPDWPDFYRSIHDGMWREVDKAKTLPVKLRKTVWRVHDSLQRLIAHDDQPRLVHWDIWSSNVLAKPDATGRWRVSALLDPNCKYAHAEAELAYLELFNTSSAAFLKAYQRDRRLPPEYHRVRKLVYQLYSLVDHVNLFGQEYHRPLESAAASLAPFV